MVIFVEMRIQPEISGVSAVLLGKFNPAMLTPAWLAYHGVFTKQQAKAVEQQITLPDFSSFISEALSLQATQERIMVEVATAPYVRIQDFLLQIFKEQLANAPVDAFVIIRNVHFLAPSSEHGDALGRQLAPLGPWEKSAGIIDFSGKQSGMASLQMRQSPIDGRPSQDHINVCIEPSVKVGHRHQGVYVGVNDYYSIGDIRGDTSPGEYLINLLESRFEPSIDHSDQIVDYIMSLAKQDPTN